MGERPTHLVDHDPHRRRCRQSDRLHLQRASNRVKFNDVNGNHVGLDLDSMVSAQLGDLATIDVDLKSGDGGDHTRAISWRVLPAVGSWLPGSSPIFAASSSPLY
ncbi:hypothetical protein Vadar_004039 [Vaccinium darrowii]|uniref:Uncharacterized protein n=1 Tax=Vaccinium darrowii TaxID=229202 RepID=A0ACB7YSM1_9ERIC|nr:hypothetical protein Vadar_004039 [Vaccinium darrowii]